MWSSHVSVRTCDPTWTGMASQQRSGNRRYSQLFTKLSLQCALALWVRAQISIIQKSSALMLTERSAKYANLAAWLKPSMSLSRLPLKPFLWHR